jgi:uncharacterized protein YqgV (UPF0045/DUF77 family)
LYPLRQQRLSPAIEEAWKILERNQLDLKKGTMSTVVRGEMDKVFEAIKEVLLRSAEKGEVSMVVTFANACPMVLEGKAYRGDRTVS